MKGFPMTILSLYRRLSVHIPVHKILRDPARELYTFRPFMSGTASAPVFVRGELHISRFSSLMSLPAAAVPEKKELYPVPHTSYQGTALPLPESVLIPEPLSAAQIDTLADRFPGTDFLISEGSAAPAAVLDLLSGLFAEEARYLRAANRLTMIANEKQDLQGLIDEASQILNGPIIIIDNSYRIIAIATEDLTEISGTESDLEEQRRIGFLTERNLQRMKRDRLFEHLRNAPDHMYYGMAQDAHYYWMNMLLHIHGVEVGEVGIMELHRKFTDQDFSFMQLLRRMIELTLQRHNYYQPGSAESHVMFLSDLLTRDYRQEEMVQQRMRMLNWKPSPFYRILTIFPEKEENAGEDDEKLRFTEKAAVFAAQVVRHFPGIRWRVSDSNLVFLFPEAQSDLTPYLPDSPLETSLHSNHLCGVLSKPFTSLAQAKKLYQQTLDLSSIRDQIRQNTSIILYEKHAIQLMARTVEETHPLSDFYHPAAEMIRDYDLRYHTDYLTTLHEYLLCADDPSRAVSRLHIHKNTLYYRLGKIRELFPVDLSDGRTRMLLLLTMELMQTEEKN